MKRRLFKLMLTIVCLLSSLNISAYDFKVDGLYYDVVSLSERTCELVSIGDMTDVVIPAHVSYGGETLTVVGMADALFKYETSSLTGISIPNTVTSISSGMFNNCKKLERVRIEDGETVLSLGYNRKVGNGGYGLFYDCPIRSLYIGRNLSYDTSSEVGYSPFARNTQLRNIIIGDFITSIGDRMFYDCSGLTSVDIPNSITSIGDFAFSGCGALTRVNIHDIAAWCNIGFSTVSSNPLYYAHDLYLDGEKVKELVISNSVTSLGNYAFEGCSGLTSVVLPNSVTSLGTGAFEGCSGLASVVIPNSVTSIGGYTFYGCSGLASIVIPNSITSIGGYTFYGCSGLTSVIIPNSVTSIGVGAFFNCSALTDLTVGSSVKRIDSFLDKGFLKYCGALTNLYMLNPAPVFIKDDFFTNNQYMTLNVFVPEEALPAYQSADGWKNFWHLQGFTPTGIDNVKSTNMNVADSYYDLSGSKLDAPRRGVNIINGKKVIMK